MEENLGLVPMVAVVSDPDDRSYYQDDSDDVEVISDWEEPEKLRNRLSNWALTYGNSHIALSALLAILMAYHCDLQKGAQTLLNTRRDYSVRELCSGLYHYIGIIEALKHTLSQWKDKPVDGCCLHLQMSVDGLPLFKSSGLQLWPILGRLVGVPMKEPVVIGMYSGIKKPDSLKMYLTDLANELSQLQEGFTFEGKRLTLKVHSMICDAPTKSFVKVTKAFNGYCGCDKCIQSGVYLNHRMTYPYIHEQPNTD